ncbi:MAG: alpha/beta hydrolase [Acidimicrobiales bacterium]
MIHRSIHFGFDVSGADAAIGTLHYPADENRLDEARLTGVVAADLSAAPWPLVVIMPGVNVAPDSYRWLAALLVQAGFCVVTYQAIGELGPAGTGISPSMDMAALAPDVIGTRCSSPAVPAVLTALAELVGPTAGAIDFGRVIVGGHSAGGTMALHNSDPAWIDGLRGSFSFAGHTMIATSFGHGEATVVPIPSKVPIMIIGSAHDGVINASRDRYRSDSASHDPVERTFREAVSRDEQDSWFVELADGNHFTICDPIDETSGRSFLESDLRAGDTASREVLARLIVTFADQTCRNSGNDELLAVLDSAAISKWELR